MKLLFSTILLFSPYFVCAQENNLIGEWLLKETSPISLNNCEIKVEYLVNGISKSYNGDLVFTLNYDLEPHLAGYLLYLEIVSHNGKKPCSGPPADLIEKNFLSYQYIEIEGNKLKHFLSTNPNDEFSMVFEKQSNAGQKDSN